MGKVPQCERGYCVECPIPKLSDTTSSKIFKIFEKLLCGRTVRVNGNSAECENFDFMLRHNRIYNNLIISMFDKTIKKECEVCKVEVEKCMHTFYECSNLKEFFAKMIDMMT